MSVTLLEAGTQSEFSVTFFFFTQVVIHEELTGEEVKYHFYSNYTSFFFQISFDRRPRMI